MMAQVEKITNSGISQRTACRLTQVMTEIGGKEKTRFVAVAIDFKYKVRIKGRNYHRKTPASCKYTKLAETKNKQIVLEERPDTEALQETIKLKKIV